MLLSSDKAAKKEMSPRKKIVGITSFMTASLLICLSYLLEIKVLALPFGMLGLVTAGVLMSEEKHWAEGWLLQFFVLVIVLGRMVA